MNSYNENDTQTQNQEGAQLTKIAEESPQSRSMNTVQQQLVQLEHQGHDQESLLDIEKMEPEQQQPSFPTHNSMSPISHNPLLNEI